MDNFDLCTCVKCKGRHKPAFIKIDGMYYVQCPCMKWDRYQFLGLKPQFAADEWNKFNRPMARVGNRRKVEQ